MYVHLVVINADIKSTLTLNHKIKQCCISLYRLGSQYISAHLQIKYLSIAELNLDEN